MYLLGYDVGSSSVKASLVDSQSGECVASAFYPKSEAPIASPKPGWAEQDPDDWWEYVRMATKDVMTGFSPESIAAIGISYQMHGLVCVGKDLKPLRPAIIWCDSRAVPYGQKAFEAIGAEKCLDEVLKLPCRVYIGFTGILTFKNAAEVRKAASHVPLDRLLLETDSPYLAPVPHRGKVSHAGMIPDTGKVLAEVQGVPFEDLMATIRQNTHDCYGI